MTTHADNDDHPVKTEGMPQAERDIIDRIRSKIGEKGFTMSSLAEHVGMTANAGRQWKGYRALPRHRVMMAIAEALGVTANWLITGQDEPSDRAVTQIERDTLATMRELPMEIQEMILAQARALSDRERMKKR